MTRFITVEIDNILEIINIDHIIRIGRDYESITNDLTIMLSNQLCINVQCASYDDMLSKFERLKSATKSATT